MSTQQQPVCWAVIRRETLGGLGRSPERTVIVAMPRFAPGDRVDPVVCWRPDAPGPEDVATWSELRRLLRRLALEHGVRIPDPRRRA